VNVLVCVKRVPATGGRIVLTADEQDIDVRFLGFTISPHEECAVEEAVRLNETWGGETVVLTLGPEEATGQLRDAMALGIDRGILLATDGAEWDAVSTALAIADAIRTQPVVFDLVLFGNEAADTGDYQIGVRVAHQLGLPCVTGIKALEIRDGAVRVKREAAGGWEVLEAPLPALLTVREGINLPRYPSVPGRLRAKSKPIDRQAPGRLGGGLDKIRLKLPEDIGGSVEILGEGPEAAPAVAEMFQRLGLIP
jgi:electron transfer flavoprotein beta subunit